MRRLFNFFFFLCLTCFLLMPSFHSTTSGAGGGGAQPTQLVSSICRNTTNYTFCVEALYSDHRTPTADRRVLAYISFDMTYLNATGSKAYIDDLLLHNATSSGGLRGYSQSLQRCDRLYEQAVAVLAEAINDLDSETYSELASLASDAALRARDCESSFQGGPSPLSRMNHDLRALSSICVVISNLFTISS